MGKVITYFTSTALTFLLLLPSSSRAEAFGPLGDAMHAMSSAMMTIDAPKSTFFGKPLPSIQQLKNAAALVRDNAATVAPAEIQKQPAVLQAFTDLFQQIYLKAEAAEKAYGPVGDKPTENQLLICKNLSQDMKRLQEAGHNNFIFFQRPVPPQPEVENSLADLSPLRRDIDPAGASELSGDRPSDVHKLLWNREGLIKSLPNQQLPAATLNADVVIVGGGMSGLISAYELRDKKVVILEQAKRLGGNSKGESWAGTDYGIGAAYIDPPAPGSPIEKLLKDLGVLSQMKVHDSNQDPLFINGKRVDDVWANGTNSNNKKQFNFLKNYFEDMLAGRHGLKFPEIPPSNDQDRKYVDSLDRLSFKAHLESIVGGPLDPDVFAVLDRYCWSALGSGLEEVSAAAGLNFFVGDLKAVLVPPGGNAMIAEALTREILKTTNAANIKTEALVVNVQVLADQSGADVTYVRPDQTLVTVRTKKVVMSAPKFIAGRIIPDLEPERLAAIKKMKYRSYLVANLLVNKQNLLDAKGNPQFYDAYFIDPSEKRGDHVLPLGTDVVYGNYANPDANHVILTLYRPIPNDGARSTLLPATFDSLSADFNQQIKTQILPALGVDPVNYSGLRIALWGHAMPVALPGHFSAKDSSGKAMADYLRAPFKQTIYFANQDSLALPGFESLSAEAFMAAQNIRTQLEPPATGKALLFQKFKKPSLKTLNANNLCPAVFR